MQVKIFQVIPDVNCFMVFLAIIILGGCRDSKESRLQVFLEIGNATMAQSNADQAIYYYEQALAVDSCYADALNNIGTVHYKAHRFDEAIHFYSKAIICRPSFYLAYFNRANTMLGSRKYIEPLSDGNQLLAMKPD